MSAAKPQSLFRRMIKLAALLGVLVTLVGAVAGYVMRDRIIARILDIAENRLSEKGLYIKHGSHQLIWNRGVVLKEFSLFVDQAKLNRIALFENIGIRIPLHELFGSSPNLILSSGQGDLKIDTSAGPLYVDDVDFRLTFTRESLKMERLEGQLNGLHITTRGVLRWEKGDGAQKVRIPDLAPVVTAAKWLDFPKGRPTLALQINPRDGPGGGVDIKGLLSGRDFQWRNLSFDRARIQAQLKEGALEMPEVAVDCYGGSLTGSMSIDYQNGKLSVSRITSTAEPFRLISAVLGGQALKSFRTLGNTTLSGRDMGFDLKDFPRSTGVFTVSAPAGIVIPLAENDIQLERFRGELRFESGNLMVDAKEFTVHGGKGSGSYVMPLSQGCRYRLSAKVDGVSLEQAGRSFGIKEDLAGTMRASFEGGGATSDRSHHGKGTVNVDDGKFYAVPVVGSLRAFLTRKSAKFGMDVAEDLDAAFTLEKGVVRSEDFRIESIATRMTAHGEVDLVGKTLDVDVRANLKGLPGVATEIVSYALTVNGEGPVDNVRWKFVNAAGLVGEAAKAAAGGVKAAAEGVGDVMKGAGEAAGKLLEWRPGKLLEEEKAKERK